MFALITCMMPAPIPENWKPDTDHFGTNSENFGRVSPSLGGRAQGAADPLTAFAGRDAGNAQLQSDWDLVFATQKSLIDHYETSTDTGGRPGPSSDDPASSPSKSPQNAHGWGLGESRDTEIGSESVGKSGDQIRRGDIEPLPYLANTSSLSSPYRKLPGNRSSQVCEGNSKLHERPSRKLNTDAIKSTTAQPSPASVSQPNFSQVMPGPVNVSDRQGQLRDSGSVRVGFESDVGLPGARVTDKAFANGAARPTGWLANRDGESSPVVNTEVGEPRANNSTGLIYPTKDPSTEVNSSFLSALQESTNSTSIDNVSRLSGKVPTHSIPASTQAIVERSGLRFADNSNTTQINTESDPLAAFSDERMLPHSLHSWSQAASVQSLAEGNPLVHRLSGSNSGTAAASRFGGDIQLQLSKNPGVNSLSLGSSSKTDRMVSSNVENSHPENSQIDDLEVHNQGAGTGTQVQVESPQSISRAKVKDSETANESTHSGGLAGLRLEALSHQGFSETGSPGVRGIAVSSLQERLTAEQSELNRNPFSAMDSKDSNISSAASFPGAQAFNQLQVGYQDPDLGYIELRAHSSGGGVHASLEAQSPLTGETLAGQVVSLADWMNEHQAPLETITIMASNSGNDAAHSFHNEQIFSDGSFGEYQGGMSSGNGDTGDGRHQNNHGFADDSSHSISHVRSESTAILQRPSANANLNISIPQLAAGNSISYLV